MPETLGKSLQEVDEVWETRMKRSREMLKSIATFGVGRRHRNEEDVELEERSARV